MLLINNKKILFKKRIIFLLIISFCFVSALPIHANAEKSGLERIKDGFDKTTDIIFAQDPHSLPNSPNAIQKPTVGPIAIVASLLNIVLGFIGILYLIMMVAAGFMWIGSKGNEETVKKAKDMIMHATVGVLMTMAAFAISFFVLYVFLQSTALR